MNKDINGVGNEVIEIPDEDLAINYKWTNENDEYDDFEQEITENTQALIYGFDRDIFMSENEYIAEQKEIYELELWLRRYLYAMYPSIKLFVEDLHSNNIGRDKNTGKLLIVDYAWTRRDENK